jgi:hypothetical protein
MNNYPMASERLWLLLGYQVKPSEKCWPIRLGKDGTWLYSRSQVDGIINGFGGE